jgi:hypothetical protein
MSIARLTDKQQWELFIPQMGYMALLRNLRNFDHASIDSKLAYQIGEKLSDPENVEKSKQFPYAFHTAWLNVPSVRWKKYLDKAVDLSVPNIPELDGRNLILVDTSASMGAELSSQARAHMRRKKIVSPETGADAYVEPKVPSCVDAAALFGIALGMKNPGRVDLWSFASGVEDLTALTNPPPGEGVLSAMEVFSSRIGAVGHGTDIGPSIRATYRDHDRVFIFTDMQSMPDENNFNPYNRDVTSSVPEDRHVYGFNLSGYSTSSMNTGSFRHEMGGLTDATFSLIKNIEQGVSGEWPWTK